MERQQQLPLFDPATMSHPEVVQAWREAFDKELRRCGGNGIVAAARIARDQPALHRAYQGRLTTPTNKQEG
jgi:hypothetical protein